MKEERKIGNCSLDKLISMLLQGWRIKRFIYRGIRYMPCWITRGTNPIVFLATDWYVYLPNEPPKWIGGASHESGFNTITFERDVENEKT